MSTNVELPLALYKANVKFLTSVNRLIQQNGQQWLDYSRALLDDGINESTAQETKLAKADEWQKLLVLSAESFWHPFQQRSTDCRGVEEAFGIQTSFAHGLQALVQTWQAETVAAVGNGTLSPAAFTGVWSDLLKPWERLSTSTWNDLLRLWEPLAPETAPKTRKAA